MKLFALAALQAAFVSALFVSFGWAIWWAILAGIGLTLATWSVTTLLVLWTRMRQAQAAIDRIWPPSTSQF